MPEYRRLGVGTNCDRSDQVCTLNRPLAKGLPLVYFVICGVTKVKGPVTVSRLRRE